MNKIMVFLLIILLLGQNMQVVSANSAPYTWTHYPSSSMMTIDTDTSISVTEENLHFDFSGDNEGMYSLSGQVSAEYLMKNTEDSEVTSKMVFPFIQNMWHTQEEEVDVLVDGEKVPYEIYYGDVAKHNDEDPPVYIMDIEGIISSVTNEQYIPENFSYDEKGTLYRISAESDEDETYLRVEFTLDENNQKVISKGGNSYSYREGGIYELGSFLRGDEAPMEIFVTGNGLDLKISGYVNGAEDAEKSEGFKFEVIEEDMDLYTYYNGYLSSSEYFQLKDTVTAQEENLYFEALDRAFSEQDHATEDMISMYLGEARYIIIAYEVPFEALEEKTVEVRYVTYGSMDRRETVEPTYTYDYLLHPAGNWKDFKDLTIKITPSSEYPYVLESNLELTKEDDGTYTGEFKSLPDEDLRFTLFEREEITAMDKMRGSLSRNQYAFFFIGTLLLSFLALGLLGLIIKKIILKFIKKD